MKRAVFTLITLLMLVSVSAFAQVTAVPGLLNFQGRLAKPDGTPVGDGSYSVKFSLFSTATGGSPKWTETLSALAVRNGVFATLLGKTVAFPATLFNGNLFLEITVGSDPPLTPRQQIVSVAYAMKANSVPDGSIGAAQIANGSITADKLATNFFNPLVWLLNGNSGVTTGFLGTTDTNPLVFKVNSKQAMRYVYAENTATSGQEFRGINVLGGADINSIDAGVVGATIAGGGRDLFTGTDLPNHIMKDFGTISGGENNLVAGQSGTIGGGSGNKVMGDYMTIGGGQNNVVDNTGVTDYIGSTIGGGLGNSAVLHGSTIAGGEGNSTQQYDTVGGGYHNHVKGFYAVAGGGFSNTIDGPFGVIGGGDRNQIMASEAVVAGGQQNIASGLNATVGGGYGNTASGFYSTVPGGSANQAVGKGSFAAGVFARANHDGTFVWGDYNAVPVSSTGLNQFLIRAAGGVGLVSGTYLDTGFGVSGREQNAGKIGYGLFTANTLDIVGGGPGVGTRKAKIWAEGGTTFTGSITVVGTTYTSDARYKKNIAPFDNALDTVLHLHGVTYEWNREQWKDKGFGAGRQIGFIAQEVEKVLPELVVTDADGYKSVMYANVVPVLVEAVKTLNAKVDEKQKQIDELRAQVREIEALKVQVRENAEIKKQLAELAALLKKMQDEKNR